MCRQGVGKPVEAAAVPADEKVLKKPGKEAQAADEDASNSTSTTACIRCWNNAFSKRRL